MTCGTLMHKAYIEYSYTLFIYINGHKTVSYHHFTLSDTIQLFLIAYNVLPYRTSCVHEIVPSIFPPMGGLGGHVPLHMYLGNFMLILINFNV